MLSYTRNASAKSVEVNKDREDGFFGVVIVDVDTARVRVILSNTLALTVSDISVIIPSLNGLHTSDVSS